MTQKIIEQIRIQTNHSSNQIKAVYDLLGQDASIPFIARYRKELTGSLNEVEITEIRDLINRIEELNDRKSAILKSLEKQDCLTDTLKKDIDAASSLTILEDLYLPYKPKRKTKGTAAKEKGLEPLAIKILKQTNLDLKKEAQSYISSENGLNNIEDVLSGARDIIAEIINENQEAREQLRALYSKKAIFVSSVIKKMEQEGIKYKDYYNWSEPINNIPSHRVLALRRGEKEKVLTLSIQPDENAAIKILENIFVKNIGEDSLQIKLAIKDAFKRLLSRSMETEVRISSKKAADIEAIKIFSDNLRQLLLAPPLGAKNIMGIDPGFRTGCKIACINSQGQLLYHTTIFPNTSKNKDNEAKKAIINCCDKFEIEAIAIGNGTAGRETELFVKSIGLNKKIIITPVNESGASIYSASETAREEFPDLDLTIRGAISIARRLMDPLAELVKIDPKSIGVGQYQHDVDQNMLKSSLDDVVRSCVNGVGVDLNTASPQILSYVSGLSGNLAKKIITYRNQNGAFTDREELKKIPRLGPKTFEQAAGFLRINNAVNPLDRSGVHPESYHIVKKMASDLNCTIQELIENPEIRSQIKLSSYVNDTTGLPTLKDIVEELGKPGRDPREEFKSFSFAEGINSIKDLYEGMKLPGKITNITAFGAFVDIGVHQDGLVHISEMSDTFVKDPAKLVKVNQNVVVIVLKVDPERKRISLSMKKNPASQRKPYENKKKIKKSHKSSPQKNSNKPFNNPFAKLLK